MSDQGQTEHSDEKKADQPETLFGLPIIRVDHIETDPESFTRFILQRVAQSFDLHPIVFKGSVPPAPHGRTAEQALEYQDPLLASQVDDCEGLDAQTIAHIAEAPIDPLDEELSLEAHVKDCQDCAARLQRSRHIEICAHCLELKKCEPFHFAQPTKPYDLPHNDVTFDNVRGIPWAHNAMLELYQVRKVSPYGGRVITLPLCRRCRYDARHPHKGSLLLTSHTEAHQ